MTGEFPFSDVEAHWAVTCISELAARGLVNGYPDKSFKPDNTINRAEFAALMFRIFPDAATVRSPLTFADVTADYWAYPVIQWAYNHGFFSGYPDNTFKPSLPLSRAQALAVLVSGLKLGSADLAPDILTQYFDDAADIPSYFKAAVSAATAHQLVVNYPHVRQLQPNGNATRADVCAFLCQVLKIPQAVPNQYVAWHLRLEDLMGDATLSVDDLLTNNDVLVRQIQTRLYELGLYPGARWIDGRYGNGTETALKQFCDAVGLPTFTTRTLDAAFAQALLTANAADFKLEQGRDRQRIFQEYLQQEVGFNAYKLAFLDKGIESSPYRDQLTAFPDRLKEKPDGQEVKSLSFSSTPALTFQPYPKRGSRPTIDDRGLEFLHGDIKQACVCLGSIADGFMQTRWLGRQALQPVEFWSTTKIVPILNMVCSANAKAPASDIDDCLIRPQGATGGYPVHDLMVDVISYRNKIASSNSLAVMFKQFFTPDSLEQWLKQITGNAALVFRGRYGEEPFTYRPELWDQRQRKVLLSPAGSTHGGNNSLSAYDLTRVISMLGWHHYLPVEAKLPGAQWDSLESVVRSMGTDSARYLDVAIDRLGLQPVMRSPVILSKLGFGRSSIRNRTELAYVALAQFVDKRPKARGQASVLRTVAITLLCAKQLTDVNREAIETDARMAAEVTEILRRLVTEELK